ncbi:MAG: hypothetical protein U9Q62_07530 [Campylobacterota bacterium]|nr:hypothetical protein [Campylobacterota bacterium]
MPLTTFGYYAPMEKRKQQLIHDIENLLNSYEGGSVTTIDANMLEFMDEASLKSIIDSLLRQKEKTVESNSDWLEQFKKYD